MPAPMLRPADVAQRLNIPASTLRRWSYYFADYLPTHAQEPEGAATRSHRRYSEEDVGVLTEIKQLLGRGLTYEEVGLHLAERSSGTEQTGDEGVVEVVAETIEPSDENGEPDAANASETGEQRAIVNQPDEAGSRPELANLIAETLFSLSDSQQIILSGQQTSRQLLGVVLQDNFNLKEENSRLRERILEAERKLFELKREIDSNQAHDRERMRQMESYLFELQRRLDSLAPQVVRHAAPAAAAKPAAAPVAATAAVAATAVAAAPAPTVVAPAAQPVPPAQTPTPTPPLPPTTSSAPAPPAVMAPTEAALVPPPPPEAPSYPGPAGEAPFEDESEPISPFAPPRPPAAKTTPPVTAQPEAEVPFPPSPPSTDSVVQVAPAAGTTTSVAAQPQAAVPPPPSSPPPVTVAQPAAPTSAPASTGRWQRFTDWLFGRNMEE